MFGILNRNTKEPEIIEPVLKQLYIELTNRCNLKCRMCARRFTEVDLGDIRFEVFEKLIPVIGNCEIVALNGWGESLVHPGFLDFLGMIPEGGPRIELTTNAMLLDEKTIQCFSRLPSTLIVSVDGATPATLEQIRSGSDYSRILGSLDIICRLKKETGSSYPVVNVAFVAMRSNITELPDLIRLLKTRNITHLNVIFLVAHGHELESESLYFYPNLYNHWIDKARKEAEQAGISFSFPGYLEGSGENVNRDSTPSRQLWLTCEAPFQIALIQHNGSVLPCCVSESVMGNLDEEDFTSIWTGKRFTDFRKRIRTLDPPEECRYCHQGLTQDINDRNTHIKILEE